MFLVLNFSPEGGQVAIPWRKQMLKFNFMDGMFNIQLHNLLQKKSSHMFILSLKRIPQFTSTTPAKKGKVAYPTRQQREKTYQSWLLWNQDSVSDFLRGKRIMCKVAAIALCLSKGNKEFKEKNKEEFFLTHFSFFPSLSVIIM